MMTVAVMSAFNPVPTGFTMELSESGNIIYLFDCCFAGAWEMETVMGLIPNDEHVAMARQELKSAGFTENQISVLFKPADVWQRLDGRQKAQVVLKLAAVGAIIGLVVGALYGVPAGVLNCKFMSCPLRTSAAFLILISLYWVVAGGLLGAIVGLDRLEQDLYSYIEGVRRGQALFVVEVPKGRIAVAKRVLRQEQGIVIHEAHEAMGAR